MIVECETTEQRDGALKSRSFVRSLFFNEG